jgi:thiamine biosynthesis lipoprotein ApbE
MSIIQRKIKDYNFKNSQITNLNNPRQKVKKVRKKLAKLLKEASNWHLIINTESIS